MARLTASDYFHQLIGQGMTDAQASAQVAAVMRHRASEDSGAKASLELQKAANYSARANQSGSAGGSGGGASGTDQGL